MGQIDKRAVGKIYLCLFVSRIPQPESPLHRSPALQGPNTTLAEHFFLLVPRGGICHLQHYTRSKRCSDVITSSLQTAPLRAAENHYSTFADGKDRAEGTSEQLQRRSRNPRATCAPPTTLPQNKQLGLAEEGACFSLTKQFHHRWHEHSLSPKASNLSLKEISVLFPRPPAKKKPFANPSVFFSASESLSPFLTEHLFAVPFYNNFHVKTCPVPSVWQVSPVFDKCQRNPIKARPRAPQCKGHHVLNTLTVLNK